MFNLFEFEILLPAFFSISVSFLFRQSFDRESLFFLGLHFLAECFSNSGLSELAAFVHG